MAKKKKSEDDLEERKRIKRERERKRREKIKSDPEMYEQQRQKEKERYLKRKREGKIKLINELPERERRYKRKKWVVNNRTYRKRKELLKTVEGRLVLETPPSSDTENIPARNIELEHKRQLARLRSKHYREINRQKDIIDSLKKKNRAYSQKISRMKQAEKDSEIQVLKVLTPNKVVEKMTEGIQVTPQIKKKTRKSQKADRLVAESKDIANFDKFYQPIKSNVANVIIYSITEDEIKKTENQIVGDMPPVKGTKQIHNVTWNR